MHSQSKKNDFFIDDEDGSKVLLSNGTIHTANLSEEDIHKAEITEAVEGFKHLVLAAGYPLTAYETKMLNDLLKQYSNEYTLESIAFMQRYLQKFHTNDIISFMYSVLLRKEDNLVDNDPHIYKMLMRRDKDMLDQCISYSIP